MMNEASNWRNIIARRICRLLRRSLSVNLSNVNLWSLVFSDSPWVSAKKYKSLYFFLQRLPSTAPLDSGSEYEILRVSLNELEDFLDQKLRFYNFVEGFENQIKVDVLRKKASRLGLPTKVSKANLLKNIKMKLAERSSLRRLSAAEVVHAVQPGAFLYFIMHYKRSFCRVSFIVTGMRKQNDKFLVLKFPETKSDKFIEDELRLKVSKWK